MFLSNRRKRLFRYGEPCVDPRRSSEKLSANRKCKLGYLSGNCLVYKIELIFSSFVSSNQLTLRPVASATLMACWCPFSLANRSFQKNCSIVFGLSVSSCLFFSFSISCHLFQYSAVPHFFAVLRSLDVQRYMDDTTDASGKSPPFHEHAGSEW